jgi:hemin uptake protein HemP
MNPTRRDTPPQPPASPAPAPRGAAPAALPRVSSEQLFPGGAAELLIDHRGSLYRLKQTSLGKLILTK